MALSRLMDEYVNNGYCILQYDESNCSELEKYIASLDYRIENKDFVYSLLTFNPEINIEISNRVTAFFKKSLADSQSHQFLTGSFLIKPAHITHQLMLHQDWTYAEHEQPSPITCWAPLTDTGPESGGIFLIKGSQYFFKNYLSNSYQTSRFSNLELNDNTITYLEVKRGEILLFNPAVWHGSAVNRNNKPRIAVTCLMIPANTKLLYFHKNDAETCLVYEMPDYGLETHLRDLVNNNVPGSFKFLKKIPYCHKLYSSADLINACDV